MHRLASSLRPTQLRECREAPLVDSGLNVAVPNALEVDHRRGDVAVSHPLLQGPDVDAVLEVPRGIRVAEFVQEPTATVGSFGTAIDLYGSVFQLVAHSAMTAVQFPAICDRLEFFQHGAVWPASGTGEQRIVWSRVCGTEFLKHRH